MCVFVQSSLFNMSATCVDEIRFRNFLSACKKRAVEKVADDLWRLEQYVAYLSELLAKLENEHSKIIGDDVMRQYREDVGFLKKVVAVEKETNFDRKILASQNLVVPIERQTSPSADSADSTQRKVSTSKQEVSMKNVKLQTNAQISKDLRRQLLGLDDDNNNASALKLRKSGDVLETQNADIDAVLKHHYQLQEQLADEFLNLTINLKHNVAAAGRVVNEDRQTLDRIHTKADQNYKELNVESKRLSKFAYASCDCMIWLMLLVVCLTFIGMVLFMRLFTKR